MPVDTFVIVPTSRGVSCGVKASRTCAYSSERAVEDTLQAFTARCSSVCRVQTVRLCGGCGFGSLGRLQAEACDSQRPQA